MRTWQVDSLSVQELGDYLCESPLERMFCCLNSDNYVCSMIPWDIEWWSRAEIRHAYISPLKNISSYFKNQSILVSGQAFYDSGKRREEKKNHSRESNFIGQSITAIEFVDGVFCVCFYILEWISKISILRNRFCFYDRKTSESIF